MKYTKLCSCMGCHTTLIQVRMMCSRCVLSAERAEEHWDRCGCVTT